MAQLLASPNWAHVTTVGRRAGPPPPVQQAHKLTQTVVDMDALASEGAAAFAGADVAFCTLGTKRRIAGSADAYIKAGCPGCSLCRAAWHLRAHFMQPLEPAGLCLGPLDNRCCHARVSLVTWVTCRWT